MCLADTESRNNTIRRRIREQMIALLVVPVWASISSFRVVGREVEALFFYKPLLQQEEPLVAGYRPHRLQ